MMSYIPTLQSKYKNIKTTVDGIKFDSKREAKRYAELKLLEKAGEISALELQRDYQVIEPVVICGIRQRAIIYRADFVYCRNGQVVVEDVKGMRTDAYKLKRRLMKVVHGIEVIEI